MNSQLNDKLNDILADLEMEEQNEVIVSSRD